VILTNELPRFSDASGALTKRFVVAVLRETFYGRENPNLLVELGPELPGILNWSLDGLDRLRAQGHFTEPASSRETIRDMEDLVSPMSAFIRDRMRIDRGARVGVDHAWSEWKAWCEDQSHPHGTKQMFGRDLRAAVAGLRVSRPRSDDHARVYVGIGLPGEENNHADRGPRGPSGPFGGEETASNSDEPRGPRGPRSKASSAEVPSVRCSDYRAHQSYHRQVRGRWVCDACDFSVD
jgi:putative DNA primase/helicase